MSAFAREFANKELRGIIDGKDNVFNKTCQGWSWRHCTPSKARTFEMPTDPLTDRPTDRSTDRPRALCWACLLLYGPQTLVLSTAGNA